jgi:hypothetical protein
LEAILKSGRLGDSQVHVWLDRQPALEARAGEAFETFRKYCKTPEIANLGDLTYTDSEKQVGLQAADLYAYVWYRNLTQTMNGQLPRAFAVLTRKKPTIVVTGKRYFDNLLDHAARDRAAAIERRLRTPL